MKQFLILLLCAFAYKGFAQSSPDSAEVATTMNSFVDAFSNLRWEKFSAFFPPSARTPYRANNKQEILDIFRKVFDHAQQQNPSYPHIVIQPLDLKIQLAGTTAIVTFTLRDPDLFGRRTIVLKKDNDRWLILHLHASGVAL
ncbi:YybH family protein [Puia sp. P3]|uniref:YybH family protein n=1 Tax=Puia sp. P3 TaxID=3423952 RepID=UPI003D67B7BE